MENDQKCADAAVRELSRKLLMANGNLVRDKKLYCGTGRKANVYEVIRSQCRKEIMGSLSNSGPSHDVGLLEIKHSSQVYARLANR